MTTWNEATPAGTDYISGGDDVIRDLKAATRERLGKEHYMLGSGDSVDDGKHRLARGAAAARPTAVAGHVYISTDTKQVSVATADGTWLDISDPIGTIKLFAGSTAPAGWLLCDGNWASRVTYAALFAVVGTMYGAGDGVTYFTLPDLKGRIPTGYNSADGDFNALGKVGGEKTHVLSVPELPTHTHTLGDPGHAHSYSEIYGPVGGGIIPIGGGPTSYGARAANVGVSGTNVSIANTGSYTAHNNLQPYIVVNYIIKY